MTLYIFMKFGSVGRTDVPIAFPLGVSHVFCSNVGGLVRARARHFGAPRKQLERNHRKSFDSIGNFQESENMNVPATEVLKKWNLHSHRAWEAQKILLPMQHGNANSSFCNTSAAKTRVQKTRCPFLLLPYGAFWAFRT